MLLILMALLIVISLALLLIRRRRDALLTFLSCVSLVLFLYAVLLFIAKKGGFDRSMIPVFFLNNAVRTHLQYRLILLKDLGFLMSVGRCLFPMFLLLLAVESITFLSSYWRRWIYGCAWILPAVTMLLYYQPVFENLTRISVVSQSALVVFSRAWIQLYTIAAVVLSIVETTTIPIRMVRRRYLQRSAMLFGLAGVFLIYCRQDPAQVYLFYRDAFMHSLGLWYLSPVMGLGAHVAILTVLVLCSVSSIAYLIRLTMVDLMERRASTERKKRSDIALTSGNIFVHSIKNQLLVQQKMIAQMEHTIQQQEGDHQQLQQEMAQLHQTTDTLLTHINDLYRTFREPHLKLNSVSVSKLLQNVTERLKRKYPDAKLDVSLKGPGQLLADENAMTEALLNIVMNCWEANCTAGRDDQPVAVSSYASQLYTVIEIRDCGLGIPKAMRSKIFEPFFTSKNTNHNWGMGLYYASRIIHRHVGSIQVDSEVGAYSVFYVLLPQFHSGGTEP